MPFAIWPTPGFYRVSSGFRTAERPTHNGIDIARNITPHEPIYGAEIVAVADGRVSAVGTYHKSKGNWLELDHGGSFKTRYKHNLRNLVKRGQYVRQGEVIALVGNTGRSSGPHLHIETIFNGRHIDPMEILCTSKREPICSGVAVELPVIEILDLPVVPYWRGEPVKENKPRVPSFFTRILARLFSR